MICQSFNLSEFSCLKVIQHERKEMKKIVLDFEQRQEEEEYQGGCVGVGVYIDC